MPDPDRVSGGSGMQRQPRTERAIAPARRHRRRSPSRDPQPPTAPRSDPKRLQYREWDTAVKTIDLINRLRTPTSTAASSVATASSCRRHRHPRGERDKPTNTGRARDEALRWRQLSMFCPPVHLRRASRYARRSPGAASGLLLSSATCGIQGGQPGGMFWLRRKRFSGS